MSSFTRQPRKSGVSNTTKIPREDPQERVEREKIVAGEGKKARNFWAPPPFGASSLRGPTFPGFGPHPSGPHNDKHQIQKWIAKVGLAEIGQIRMAKTGLAKVGLFRSTPPQKMSVRAAGVDLPECRERRRGKHKKVRVFFFFLKTSLALKNSAPAPSD